MVAAFPFDLQTLTIVVACVTFRLQTNTPTGSDPAIVTLQHMQLAQCARACFDNRKCLSFYAHVQSGACLLFPSLTPSTSHIEKFNGWNYYIM